LTLEDDATTLTTEDGTYEIEAGGDYEFGSNSVLLTVDSGGGTVVITGNPYIDNVQSHEFTEDGITDDTNTNKLETTKATLVDPTIAQTVLDRMTDFYQLRYKQSMTLFPTLVTTGDVITTSATLYTKELIGTVTKMEIDLTGGYLAQTKIIGKEVT
jgi:hypothetical protein